MKIYTLLFTTQENGGIATNQIVCTTTSKLNAQAKMVELYNQTKNEYASFNIEYLFEDSFTLEDDCVYRADGEIIETDLIERKVYTVYTDYATKRISEYIAADSEREMWEIYEKHHNMELVKYRFIYGSQLYEGEKGMAYTWKKP